MTGSDADCTFCGWVRSSSGSLVFVDQETAAGIDPRQPHEGHVLVMPLRHLPTVFDLDDVVAAAIMTTTVRIARAVRATFAPEGLSLWQSNGPAAFQEIPHFHMHLMPRWQGDELLQIYPRRVANVDQRARGVAAHHRHLVLGQLAPFQGGPGPGQLAQAAGHEHQGAGPGPATRRTSRPPTGRPS